MPRKGNVTRPRIEPMLMIRPSRFWRIEGSTARVTRRSPMTFVSKTTFACSAVKASVTPTDMIPALLTSTSILPASASTCLTPASTDASSLTSNSTVLMPRFRRASAASRFLPCARRIEAYTVWPARNRVSAVSRPKPLLAPVIRIVLDILGLLEVHASDARVDGVVAGHECNLDVELAHLRYPFQSSVSRGSGRRCGGRDLSHERHEQGRDHEGEHDRMERIGEGQGGGLAIGQVPESLERSHKAGLAA